MVKTGQEKQIRNLAELAERVVGRSGPVRIAGLRGAAKAVAAAQLVRAAGDLPVLFLTATAKQTDGFVEDLRAALSQPPPEEGGRVRPFPHHDTTAGSTQTYSLSMCFASKPMAAAVWWSPRIWLAARYRSHLTCARPSRATS